MGGRTHGKTTSDIVAELEAIHGDKFLYDKIDYKNTKSKIIIGCKQHGYFEKWPNDIKKSNGGCPRCNNSWNKTHDEFITELTDLYPHVKCLGEYRNAKTKLEFECVIHNYNFTAEPNGILSKHVNCPECLAAKQVATKLQRSKSVIDPTLKSEYELYKNAVWRFSNRTYKKFMSGQIRDRQNHLDHVLSIVEAFQQKVLPEIAGSIHNLRIITGQANRIKSYKSDITVEELLKRYSK
jgi:hypothetical protein